MFSFLRKLTKVIFKILNSIFGETMATRDVWLALSEVFGFLALLLFISFLGNVFISFIIFDNEKFTFIYTLYVFIGLLIIFSKFTFNMWQSYYKGIEIDFETKTFSFPKSDVENSIIDIITLKQFRDLQKREVLNLLDIEALNNETKRWSTKSKDSNGKTVTTQHVQYLLNISGEFGSRQLKFSSKQKRDECRAMMNSAVKKQGSRISSSDMNLDFQ
jgi:signal transduction histidine kinase